VKVTARRRIVPCRVIPGPLVGQSPLTEQAEHHAYSVHGSRITSKWKTEKSHRLLRQPLASSATVEDLVRPLPPASAGQTFLARSGPESIDGSICAGPGLDICSCPLRAAGEKFEGVGHVPRTGFEVFTAARGAHRLPRTRGVRPRPCHARRGGCNGSRRCEREQHRCSPDRDNGAGTHNVDSTVRAAAPASP
jgi:hypothetical protein